MSMRGPRPKTFLRQAYPPDGPFEKPQNVGSLAALLFRDMVIRPDPYTGKEAGKHDLKARDLTSALPIRSFETIPSMLRRLTTFQTLSPMIVTVDPGCASG